MTHKWNLIVGDLFKVKDDYALYGDMAQELIAWLHSKTHVLAILREIQMATISKTLAILRPVLTRWLSHYLAYRRLLAHNTVTQTRLRRAAEVDNVPRETGHPMWAHGNNCTMIYGWANGVVGIRWTRMGRKYIVWMNIGLCIM